MNFKSNKFNLIIFLCVKFFQNEKFSKRKKIFKKKFSKRKKNSEPHNLNLKYKNREAVVSLMLNI